MTPPNTTPTDSRPTSQFTAEDYERCAERVRSESDLTPANHDAWIMLRAAADLARECESLRDECNESAEEIQVILGKLHTAERTLQRVRGLRRKFRMTYSRQPQKVGAMRAPIAIRCITPSKPPCANC